MGMENITKLTVKLAKKYEVLIKANAGILTVKEAAEELGLSERQVQRLKKEVKESGAAALIHGNTRGRTNNCISEEVKAEIVRLKQNKPYNTCNFNHYKDLLAEHHGIDISYSSLHGILTEAELKSPKKRRRYKPHRRRKRRLQAGMLIQVDATSFAWFEDDKKRYALHGGIDDATGQITGLYLCRNECLQGYFEMLRRTITNYGVPQSLYADRHTIFQSPNRGKANIDPNAIINDTQFGRCLNELSVQLIAARSPQAKGRVERLWQTLQSRLPVEFAIRGITTVETANAFLEMYIYDFNSQFAVEPEDADSVFDRHFDREKLNYILCLKEQRSVDAGGIFSYNGKQFKVCDDDFGWSLPPRAKASVLISPVFGIKAEYRGIVYDVERFIAPKRQAKQINKQKPVKMPTPIPDGHYHKYGKHDALPICYDESDKEILKMLHDIFLGKYV
jgi:transposase